MKIPFVIDDRHHRLADTRADSRKKSRRDYLKLL